MSPIEFLLLIFVLIGFAFIYLIEAYLIDLFAYINKLISKIKPSEPDAQKRPKGIGDKNEYNS